MISILSNATKDPHTPAIRQKRDTLVRWDSFWIVEVLPWQLGECLPARKSTAFPLSESILLRIGGVPYPVDEQVRDVKETQSNRIPVVIRRWVIS